DCPLTDFGGITGVFSFPVYLFLRKFCLHDSRGGSITRRQQYRSYSSSIVLTQPLFDYEAYARYKASMAQTMMSDERYRSKLLNLAVRVINAYVEVAHAKDQIALVEAQKAAYKEQLMLNVRRMNAGEGTLTDISETQARYSLT
ncbi:TolC family protein, partial [Escherichia coli]|uniref:TolC family protein n=1 Tax=Escherichia coli TaxID=562 RepID=UPI00131A0365